MAARGGRHGGARKAAQFIFVPLHPHLKWMGAGIECYPFLLTARILSKMSSNDPSNPSPQSNKAPTETTAFSDVFGRLLSEVEEAEQKRAVLGKRCEEFLRMMAKTGAAYQIYVSMRLRDFPAMLDRVIAFVPVLEEAGWRDATFLARSRSPEVRAQLELFRAGLREGRAGVERQAEKLLGQGAEFVRSVQWAFNSNECLECIYRAHPDNPYYTVPPVDKLFTLEEILSLAALNLKTFQNKYAAKDRPDPKIKGSGRNPDFYEWQPMRDFLLQKEPGAAASLPETQADARRILQERVPDSKLSESEDKM